MSTLNNVFKKLEHTDKVAKVNLESQKVELALVDDIKASVLFAKKMKEDITVNFANANGGLRACEEFKKNYSLALQKAKELGVEVPKQLDGLTKMMDDYEKFFTKINSL
jgi:hypothetical protein